MKRYQLGLYEKALPASLSWREKMEWAKKAGFDYIEISIDETEERLSRLEWSMEQRMEFNDMMVQTGIPIRSMCLSGHRKYPLGSHDPAIAACGMDIMEKAVCLAEDLGIRTIQLAGYDVYYEESDSGTRSRFQENLAKAVSMAAKGGVVLGFETMETEFMNTVEKAMSFVAKIQSPYLQVYPDIGNITNAAKCCGGDVFDDLKTGTGHLVAMHLKETVPGVFREVPFGTGHVDFESAIQTAWMLGVRRYVAEFWYTGSETWADDVFYARKMLGGILDRQAEERGSDVRCTMSREGSHNAGRTETKSV